MCGIAAAVGQDLCNAVEAMCARMYARGPDDGGVAVLNGAVLGNRRLAIIDPSPAGHQPMTDAARGSTITYNGMLYNFNELRQELESAGETFVSRCDTEVVLKAYGRYGRDCMHRLRGMFAFAIWDDRRRELFIARDRLGIKPLYYTHLEGVFACASQVKALLASGLVPPRLSSHGISSFLAFGAVREPWTAIDGVLPLPAGHRATFRDGRLEIERYWEPPVAEEQSLTREDAVHELRARLEDSVRRHLVSDVPIGVFLSGGVDSSALAALSTRADAHVRTLSVAFAGNRLSEGSRAAEFAQRIGSDHTEIDLDADSLISQLDDAFDAMDQPSFDGINTYAVSRAAHDAGLKVALSGLGGDELFDGYGYARRVRALERGRALPRPLAAAAGEALGLALPGSRGQKARDWLRQTDQATPYELLRRLFSPADVMTLTGRPSNGERWIEELPSDVYTRVAILDLTNYTKDILLRDTDAMSMGCSLEVRVPFLDDELVDWVLRLPERVKRPGSKTLLKEAMSDALGRDIIGRGKQGFLLPFALWMRGALRDEVQGTLLSPPPELAALIEQRSVERVWASFQEGRSGWQQPWSLYALGRWVTGLTSPVAAAS